MSNEGRIDLTCCRILHAPCASLIIFGSSHGLLQATRAVSCTDTLGVGLAKPFLGYRYLTTDTFFVAQLCLVATARHMTVLLSLAVARMQSRIAFGSVHMYVQGFKIRAKSQNSSVVDDSHKRLTIGARNILCLLSLLIQTSKVAGCRSRNI